MTRHPRLTPPARRRRRLARARPRAHRLLRLLAGRCQRQPERRRDHHVLARLERAQRGRGHPVDHRRLREGAPQHPREGRRQHHRRQDQPGAAGRRLQRPRRGVVVHHRQRRRVLHLARLRRPRRRSWRSPASTRPRPSRRRSCDYTQYEGNQCALPLLSDAYGLYYNKDMFAAAGISRAAQDAVGVRRRRGEADQDLRRHLLPARLHAELPRLRVDDHPLRGPVRRRRTSPPTASPTSPTTRRSPRRIEWQKALVDKLGGYRQAREVPHHVR